MTRRASSIRSQVPSNFHCGTRQLGQEGKSSGASSRSSAAQHIEDAKVGPAPEIRERGPEQPRRLFGLEREFKLRKGRTDTVRKKEDARQRRAVLKRMIEILREKRRIHRAYYLCLYIPSSEENLR